MRKRVPVTSLLFRTPMVVCIVMRVVVCVLFAVRCVLFAVLCVPCGVVCELHAMRWMLSSVCYGLRAVFNLLCVECASLLVVPRVLCLRALLYLSVRHCPCAADVCTAACYLRLS